MPVKSFRSPATFKVRVVAALALSLTGCAAPPTHGPVKGGPVPALTEVVAQVCFPAGLHRNSIGVEVVTAISVTGGAEGITGRTSAAQPVFEFVTMHPSELRAILVRYVKLDGSFTDHFVFEPPRYIEYDSWTAWQPPSAVAVNGNWGVATGMVNGVKPATKPVPPAAPVVRYRLMMYQQRRAEQQMRRDNGLDANLPRCDVGGGTLN